MKNAFLLLSGIFVAMAGLAFLESKRSKPVVELAHQLEAAWADHHTVV